jgi:hypothetical protein|tara:strand:+ start:1211 stop:1453 length:243 start_codon:yes stop_codon:yes gene_type:complete
MNTEEERYLISETFIRAFSVSLQTLVPEDSVQEFFVAFVLSRLRIDKETDKTLELNEQFVYDCIPRFINWLNTLANTAKT